MERAPLSRPGVEGSSLRLRISWKSGKQRAEETTFDATTFESSTSLVRGYSAEGLSVEPLEC